MTANKKQVGGSGSGLMAAKNSKPAEIRSSNIRAAKALSDAIRTSLGPRGMDKMIQAPKGQKFNSASSTDYGIPFCVFNF